MVVPQQEEKHFLKLHRLTGRYLVCTAKHLGDLLTHQSLSTVGTDCAGQLLELCHLLVSLRKGSLALYPLLPTAQPPPDKQLAMLLLTSHLQTQGCTVVIGDTTTAVNKVPAIDFFFFFFLRDFIFKNKFYLIGFNFNW